MCTVLLPISDFGKGRWSTSSLHSNSLQPSLSMISVYGKMTASKWVSSDRFCRRGYYNTLLFFTGIDFQRSRCRKQRGLFYCSLPVTFLLELPCCVLPYLIQDNSYQRESGSDGDGHVKDPSNKQPRMSQNPPNSILTFGTPSPSSS